MVSEKKNPLVSRIVIACNYEKQMKETIGGEAGPGTDVRPCLAPAVK